MKEANHLLVGLLALSTSTMLLTGCQQGQAPQQQVPHLGGALAPEQATGPLSITAINDTIKPGGLINMTVQAAPRTSISVETDGMAIGSTDAASMTKRTDDSGFVTWQWQLNPDYKADKVPVIVTANYEKLDKKAVHQINIENPQKAAIIATMSGLTQQVRPGQEVTVLVSTEPRASVDIQAHGIKGTNPNITADKNGNASCTFRVDSNYDADRVPILVTVKKNDQECKLIGEIGVSQIAYKESGQNL